MTLSKTPDSDTSFWETEDFYMRRGNLEYPGYDIVNKNTGVTEMCVEQEHAGVIAIQSLQEIYSEVMHDPEREYKVTKERTSSSSRTFDMSGKKRH